MDIRMRMNECLGGALGTFRAALQRGPQSVRLLFEHAHLPGPLRPSDALLQTSQLSGAPRRCCPAPAEGADRPRGLEAAQVNVAKILFIYTTRTALPPPPQGIFTRQ
jgi:hypothetical protein